MSKSSKPTLHSGLSHDSKSHDHTHGKKGKDESDHDFKIEIIPQDKKHAEKHKNAFHDLFAKLEKKQKKSHNHKHKIEHKKSHKPKPGH
ncbi:MAG: hypothetical protein JWM09_652 [Francisellaceae bacterium]|nr:hypothetical protein [Francisellaceae bacterium]